MLARARCPQEPLLRLTARPLSKSTDGGTSSELSAEVLKNDRGEVRPPIPTPQCSSRIRFPLGRSDATRHLCAPSLPCR